MKFAIILMDTGNWRIHRDGCKDIQRDLRHANSKPFVREAESVRDAVKAEIKSLDDSFGEPSGYDESCFDILPCCKRSSSTD